jgi:type IV secretory pathway TrbF-like protein
MSISLPWVKAKLSTNGKVASATPEQRDRMSDYQRALQGEKTWKGVSKLVGAVAIASVLGNVVMAMENSPRVAVFEREPDGAIHFAGNAQQQMTPGDIAIDASIVTFLRDLREIPGGDFRLVDERLRVAHRQMTVPNSPAEKDELAFWDAHNPKSEARSMTRVIVDKNPVPTCSRLGDTLTFTCVFGEQVRDMQGNLTTVARTGMVTMKSQPTLPTDNAKAVDNPGGIDVWSISHSLVEE